MDAFESVVEMLLRREGYWIYPRYKVELTKEEKVIIGRESSPRWEIDIVAYKGFDNTILSVECKSFLDSRGVNFTNGSFQPPETYKLFSEPILRETVLNRLGAQLVESGSCANNPKVRLALAIGKMASGTKREELEMHFKDNNWELFDDHWIQNRLQDLKESKYEDDIAYVAAKLALREIKS